MFNQKFYTLICLVFLFSSIYGKIMTKDEVLKIDPKDYKGKTEDQCPDFSNGNFFYLDRCAFEFFCKDEKTCSSAVVGDNYVSTVEFPDANGNMKNYTTNVCVSENCDKDEESKCLLDSDCLSNICKNNHCYPDESMKIEVCQDVHKYNLLTFKASTEMNCGKPDGYSCSKDSECASSSCTDDVCEFQGRDHNLEVLGSLLLYAIILIVLSILGCIACCFCCC